MGLFFEVDGKALGQPSQRLGRQDVLEHPDHRLGRCKVRNAAVILDHHQAAVDLVHGQSCADDFRCPRDVRGRRSTYSFRPNASDLDGDPLTFTITGKPAWASFDSTNGTLYGTPTAGNVGVSSNVTIRVSDGKTSTSLAPFPITVSTATTKSATLNWTTPMQNTDGSALTNLAGYKVFYGTVSRQYSTTLKVVGPGTTSLVVEGLTQGTWFFAMQSYNNVGDVSDLGGEVSVVL